MPLAAIPAVVGASIIGGGASIAGGLLAKGASGQATQQQVGASAQAINQANLNAQAALAQQQGIYGQTQANYAPYLGMGQAATANLANMMGLIPQPAAPAAVPAPAPTAAPLSAAIPARPAPAVTAPVRGAPAAAAPAAAKPTTPAAPWSDVTGTAAMKIPALSKYGGNSVVLDPTTNATYARQPDGTWKYQTPQSVGAAVNAIGGWGNVQHLDPGTAMQVQQSAIQQIPSLAQHAYGMPQVQAVQNYNIAHNQPTAGPGQVQQVLNAAGTTPQAGGGTAAAPLSQMVNPSIGTSGQLMQPWTQSFNAPAPFQYGQFQMPAAFQAPTAEQAQQTPGYQFALQQAMNAMQSSAAAKGTLLTGGTQKDLANYAQGLASQTYQQTYNNALTGYQTNLSNALGAYQTNYATSLGAYNTNYNNAFQNYLQNYQQFQNNQANQYNRLMGLTNLGAQMTGQLGSLGQQAAGTTAGIYGQNTQTLANLYGAQGTAQAAGTMGQAGALSNMFGGISQAGYNYAYGGQPQSTAPYDPYSNVTALGGPGTSLWNPYSQSKPTTPAINAPSLASVGGTSGSMFPTSIG
jgi:hypothetical protein